jgi:thiol-disulfide isomerase/thioredoxin
MQSIYKIIGLVSILSFTSFGEAGEYAVDPRIPHFDLVSVDGKRYTDASLVGHPALVVFWAPWCAVCRYELPEVSDIYGRLKMKGLKVISIGFADYKENIQNYVHAHPTTFTFPVLYDPQDHVAKQLGVSGAPSIYLFNRQGELELETWLIEDPRLGSGLGALLDR